MPRLLILALVWLLVPAPAAGQPAPPEAPYLYRATLVRAAPGHLLALIDHVAAHRAALAEAGLAVPFWMRHSQGDQWDLLILQPMESYAAFYGHAAEADAALRTSWGALVARQEDVFAHGPPLPAVAAALDGAGLFHVEMFRALPGRHADLAEERAMENAYLAALARPQNLIFVRDQGAAWDAFTIGPYRDLKHFAESVDIPLEAEDAAARAAGFESVYAIAPYLRSLILEHHDTLAVAIR